MAGTYTNAKPRPGTRIDWRRPLARGLVGCWPLNEGSGAPAEVVSGALAASNSLAWSPAGVRGPVLAGTGSQYFTTPTAAGCPLDVTGSGITFGAWFLSSSTASYQAILTKQHPTTTDARHYSLFTAPGNTTQFYIQINGVAGFGASQSFDLQTSSVGWTLGAWNLVLFTYDGAAVRCYVNGQLGTSTSTSGAIATVAGSQVYCGYDTAHANYGLIGSVDQPAVWSRALSAAEIASLYRDSRQLFRRPRTQSLRGFPSSVVNASAGITLVGFSTAASGTFLDGATAAPTLGPLAGSASGTFEADGSAGIALGPIVATAAGTTIDAGSAGIALGLLSATAAGTFADLAAAPITLGGANASGAGTFATTAAASAPLGVLVAAGSGFSGCIATASPTLGGLGTAGSGSFSTTAGAGIALGPIAGSGTATFEADASASATLAPLIGSGSAFAGCFATAGLTLGTTTGVGAGTFATTASGSPLLGSAIIAAAGSGSGATPTPTLFGEVDADSATYVNVVMADAGLHECDPEAASVIE